MSLDATDSHRLHAAIGFWELGLPAEAIEELLEISPSGQNNPEVMETHLSILMELNQWPEALSLAETLCRLEPSEATHWIKIAFCLHELKRTREAKERLLSGPPSLRESALFYYNLACYECQLGQVQSAYLLLDRAVQLDANFESIAKEDSDLEPLRATPPETERS